MKYVAYLSIIVYFTSFSFISLGNNNYHGSYINESGSIVMDISNDSLIIKSYDFDLDTLAVCNWKSISESFLEINSKVDPVVTAFKDMSIHRSIQTSDTVNNPAVFRFVLPNTTEDMEIYVICGTKSYKGITQNGIFQVTLDKNISKFPEPLSFYIKPLFYSESNPASQYYGILYLSYPFNIRYNLNEMITIELPSVTPSLFYQYFIKGEYVNMTNEGLEWRGDIYYKQ